jgi:rod shape-determining protein MreC
MFARALLSVSFYEFQAPVLLAPSFVRDLQAFWGTRLHSKSELFEAGRDLARLNSAYELQIQQQEALRRQIDRMERLLALPPESAFRYEVARVSHRDITSWWQQIVIRKGRNYDIPVGAPVVFTGGVAGRVREVHAYTATIDLLSSPQVRLAAQFETDSRPVSYQGVANPPIQPPFGRVEFVSSDVDASPNAPLRLLTSGLGGIFPAGLTIGWVEVLSANPDGLFKTGRVRLDDRLNTITEVAVLVPLEGAEP